MLKPTLRLETTDEGKQNLLAAGRTAQSVMDEMAEVYRNTSLAERKQTFEAARVYHYASRSYLENYVALVNGHFTQNGILHLFLSTGDIVELRVE